MHAAHTPTGDGQDWGHRLRLQAAHRAGVPAEEATRLLARLVVLEVAEYYKTSSGLSLADRRAVLALRGRLNGLDPVAAGAAQLEPGGEVGKALTSYWPWLIYTANPPVHAGSEPPRDRIPGDLAAAIGREPHRQEFALDSWRLFAVAIGIATGRLNSALSVLAGLLRRCRPTDAQAPSRRAFDIAVEIAKLTGLPDELIEAHVRECHDQLAILWDTMEWFEASRRRAGMAGYRSGTTGRPSNMLPYLTTSPDGQSYLVLSSAEYGMLSGDIGNKVLVRLVRVLRLGEQPERKAALRSAQTVYLDRMHGKRDSEGNPVPRSLGPDPSDSAGVQEPAPQDPLLPGQEVELEPGPTTRSPEKIARRAAAVRFAVAQEWLSTAVHQQMVAVGDQLRTKGPTAIFPTRAYGDQRAATLGPVHLRAAQNCLQYLACTAKLDSATGAVLPLAPGECKVEFARHMRTTGPEHWNGSPVGRRRTSDYVGAVAWAAWQAVKGIEATDAPEMTGASANLLLAALQDFAGIAALDGMVAMTRRFARPEEGPRAGWAATIAGGTEAIQLLAGWLANRSTPDSGMRTALAGQVGELGVAYRDAGSAAGMDEVVTNAGRLLRAAEELAACGGWS